MPRAEKCFNVLLGLSFVGWAVLGVVQTEVAARYTVVRLMISALHLSAGVLLLLRSPIRRHASARDILVSLPALMIGGWAFQVAAAPQAWPWHAQVLFGAGCTLAIVTFCFLGRSFAILPALRTVVVRGPFRYVRHPAYLGELLMILACGMSPGELNALIPLCLAIPFVALRIQREELLLMSSEQYADYSRQVRWRLVPLVW